MAISRLSPNQGMDPAAIVGGFAQGGLPGAAVNSIAGRDDGIFARLRPIARMIAPAVQGAMGVPPTPQPAQAMGAMQRRLNALGSDNGTISAGGFYT